MTTVQLKNLEEQRQYLLKQERIKQEQRIQHCLKYFETILKN